MDEAGKATSVEKALAPNMIQQIRQLSVPIWARVVALVVAVGTFIGGAWLLVLGSSTCGASCDDKWLQTGTTILGTTTVPVLVLLYLAFAETGVKALTRKTKEILTRIVPTAFQSTTRSGGLGSEGVISKCEVNVRYSDGSPSALYTVVATQQDRRARLFFSLDINVNKAVVVFFVPGPATASENNSMTAAEQIKNKFKETFEGAAHEGYKIDESTNGLREGIRSYSRIVARKQLTEDFLWDPGRKLYFAQDLSFFVIAMIREGWDIFEADLGEWD